MRIGLVLDDSLDRNDGVQQYVRTLGEWLNSQGHRVEYIAGQSAHTSDRVHSVSRNIPIRFNGNKLTIPLPVPKERLKTLLDSRRYDVLHVQMPYSPMLAGKLIAYAPPQTAVVGTFHILPYGKFQTAANTVLGRTQQKTLKRFDSICSVSAAARDFAQRAYGIEGECIPNAVNTAVWKTPLHPQTGKIVFLGRLVPRKGCKELLMALHALPKALVSKLEIVIAGDGPQRPKLEALARRLGLNVLFSGYLPEADKPALLAGADLAIFPSLGGESFGIVLLEAMAAGAGTVIAGDNPGYRSVLGELADCIVDFKDTSKAGRQLARLLQDRALRRQLHRQQQQLVKQYDSVVVGKKILAMYDRALLHRRQDMR